MIYLVTVIGYFLVLVGIGVYKSREVKTQDDFMVAGRSVSTLFLVGTLVCTWIGSGSLFGGAGLAFRHGFSQLWMNAGDWVGIIIVFFLADRVRKIAKYTATDILEQRYNNAARLFGTFAIVIAYLSIAGYQFRGSGRLLNIVTDGKLDPTTGAVISCGLIILFTMLAGMVSIVSMDFFNGILMTLGVLCAVPLMLWKVGGWSAVTANLPADHFSLFGNHEFNFFGHSFHGAVWAAGVFLPTFLLLMGESSMYQKFFAAKDGRSARRAVVGMVIGVVFMEGMLCLLSVIGAAKYWSLAPFRDAAGHIDAATSETIVLQIAKADLPTVFGCLLLAAGLAIIFSTANTFLMTTSTNVTRDLYQRFINPDASQATIIRFQRIMIAVLGVLALMLATQFTTILAMAFTAYTMIGAGLTPALLAAFLWKRVTVAGGVSSIVAGIVVTLGITAANFAMAPNKFLEEDYIIIPAAAASILCLIVVSLLTKPSSEEKWKPFWSEA